VPASAVQALAGSAVGEAGGKGGHSGTYQAGLHRHVPVDLRGLTAKFEEVESMAEKKSAKNTTSARGRFTEEERSAMKERAKELKSASTKADDEKAVLAKIAEMPEPDRGLAKRLHAIVKASAPGLAPKTWYGMPAYARDGKIVCFFTPADKFKSRYATFGFNDDANLDEGSMWPTSFALTKLTSADEKRIGALVKKAVS
jgi:uncharacterized protein YdhG (YjbR/CyaY superfamily)